MRCHSYREERDYLVLRNSKHNRRTELTQTETNGITLCMYLNQPRDIMSPVWPGCTPVPPPSRTCPKHFTKESSVISSLHSLKYSNTLISVFWSPATCGHRWGWGHRLTGKWTALFSSSALSLYHNRPLQHLLYCRCRTNQSVKFSLPGSLTYEPVPKAPELFHLRHQLITRVGIPPFQLRTMASALVLILIPAPSHLDANSPSVSWRLLLDEASRTKKLLTAPWEGRAPESQKGQTDHTVPDPYDVTRTSSLRNPGHLIHSTLGV